MSSLSYWFQRIVDFSLLLAPENCCLSLILAAVFSALFRLLPYEFLSKELLIVFSLLLVPENCYLLFLNGSRELLSSLSYWLQRIVVFSPIGSRELLSSLSYRIQRIVVFSLLSAPEN
jgi:hypothetical protein